MLYLKTEGSLYQQMFQKVKKLVAVLLSSMLITDKKTEKKLD